MKKLLPLFLIAIVLALVGAMYMYQNGYVDRTPDASLNPDPNHTHADFIVLIRDEVIDFSSDQYMSGVSYDDESHDEEGEYHHKYLHLHDNVGHVLHSHKPGQTYLEFLQSLGALWAEPCLALNNTSYCPTTSERWLMYINGQEVPFDLSYTFADLDKILIAYGSSDQKIAEVLGDFPDDACLYSQACPWRGDPPKENCIADPEIPCVLPE